MFILLHQPLEAEVVGFHRAEDFRAVALAEAVEGVGNLSITDYRLTITKCQIPTYYVKASKVKITDPLC